ncbi:5-hydroxytryptamine receptor 1A-like isoform X1 [Anticarsia gemmatalis]|uniref:5-hydroxytryptamine receptor 1A-like isoform X1 n=1 Tax=Anticarsia gemmatalis TaxID=129554 RepID=UPI003F767A67
MDFNSTDLKENVTLDQVIDYFNLNISNVNKSDVNQVHLFDLYEAYRAIEKEQLMMYKFVSYILGTVIILSNLTVVISSGLILKKGQQPKSTYLLLGNVSLADTIIGIGLIFGVAVDSSVSSNPICVFQMGMLVCPAMVSIFSVGLIAVDRYIYILHGLYYQRWFNTTRVRIGILIIWMIGITLGFMPVTGWVNTELIQTRCYYVALFPGPLILINSFLSVVPLVAVAVIYSIILVQALKTVKSLNTKSCNNINTSPKAEGNTKMRIYRGSKTDSQISTQSVKHPKKPSSPKLIRSATFNVSYLGGEEIIIQPVAPPKYKSANDLARHKDSTNNNINASTESIGTHDSVFSICTTDSYISDRTVAPNELKTCKLSAQVKKICNMNKLTRKTKEPNKWRAITIVMLTTGSVIITWLPFFIAVTFFVFCEDKMTNPRCSYIRYLLGGPLPTVSFMNSLINPVIYAWWHKGFQKSVKAYLRKYFQEKYTCWKVR